MQLHEHTLTALTAPSVTFAQLNVDKMLCGWNVCEIGHISCDLTDTIQHSDKQDWKLVVQLFDVKSVAKFLSAFVYDITFRPLNFVEGGKQTVRELQLQYLLFEIDALAIVEKFHSIEIRWVWVELTLALETAA